MPQALSYYCSSTPDIVIKSLFNKYDTDDNGRLEIIELHTLLCDDLGLSDEETEAYIFLMDIHNNGSVEYQEFREWLRNDDKWSYLSDRSRFRLLLKAVELFKQYDTDASGALDTQEFSVLYADMGGHAYYIQSALKSMDKDGNGRISFYEFLKWLNWIELNTM